MSRFTLMNSYPLMSAMGGKRTLPSYREMSDHSPMETEHLKAEVLRLVAEQTGVVPDKIHPSSRLLHDLGMDGDDAVEFFDSLHERFGTDLTHLHEHWSEHFGPEGVSCWSGFIMLPAAIIGGMVAGIAGLSTFWGVAITVAVLLAWVWAMRRWGHLTGLFPSRLNKSSPLWRLVCGLAQREPSVRLGSKADIASQL